MAPPNKQAKADKKTKKEKPPKDSSSKEDDHKPISKCKDHKPKSHSKKSPSIRSKSSYQIEEADMYFNEKMTDEYLENVWYHDEPHESKNEDKSHPSSSKKTTSSGKTVNFEPSKLDKNYVEKYQDRMWHCYFTEKSSKTQEKCSKAPEDYDQDEKKPVKKTDSTQSKKSKTSQKSKNPENPKVSTKTDPCKCPAAPHCQSRLKVTDPDKSIFNCFGK